MLGKMKKVGKREAPSKVGLEEMDRLLRLAHDLYGNRGIHPRGVFKFKSFKEEEEWTLKVLAKSTRESQL